MDLFRKKFYDILEKTGIIPVFCPENREELKIVTDALMQTPVRCFEITLRNEFAPEAISLAKKENPGFFVGAGTITTMEKLKIAVECGADFCVSPGFNAGLISMSEKMNVPFLPGCGNPTEILSAEECGLSVVKFFPADCLGGVKALNLYNGALAGISFIPTGGITLENFREYIKCKNVLACGGSFMIPKDMLKAGDSEGIAGVINKCIGGN